MFHEIVKDIFPLIKDTAPGIASALGLGSLSSATPWALYLLSKAFGIDMDKVKDLPKAIINDPNHEEKLSNLNDYFSDWFSSNRVARDIKITSFELNVKLNFSPDEAPIAQ